MGMNHISSQICASLLKKSIIGFHFKIAGSSVDPPPALLQYKLVCVDLAKVLQDECRIGEQGIKDAGKIICIYFIKPNFNGDMTINAMLFICCNFACIASVALFVALWNPCGSTRVHLITWMEKWKKLCCINLFDISMQYFRLSCKLGTHAYMNVLLYPR